MSEKKPDKQILWYVKSKDTVMGPFPSGGIRRSLLLGRFTLDDQIGVDKVHWDRITEFPEVIPPEMRQDLEDGAPELLKARLREDERTGTERRKNTEGRMPTEDRRRAEPLLVERHREAKTALRHMSRKKDIPVVGILVVSLLVAIAISYGLYIGSPEALPDPDCSARPVAGVDWHNCKLDNLVADTADLNGANLGNGSFRNSRFTGAQLTNADIRYADFSSSDLSHAELREANLKGTELRNTDLSYADLTNADLSYADLTGANLGGSIFTGAKLDHAIWPDGRKCREGSLGSCLGTP